MTPNESILLELEKVIEVGHNDDCMFCGFKDKIATEAIKKWEDSSHFDISHEEQLKNKEIIEEQLIKDYNNAVDEINRLKKIIEDSPGKETGMKWVSVNEKLPKEEEEVFWDGGENPPAFGRLRRSGGIPYVILLDSSGEEEYEDIKNYERWLDESVPPYKEEEKYEDFISKAIQMNDEELEQEINIIKDRIKSRRK